MTERNKLLRAMVSFRQAFNALNSVEYWMSAVTFDADIYEPYRLEDVFIYRKEEGFQFGIGKNRSDRFGAHTLDDRSIPCGITCIVARLVPAQYSVFPTCDIRTLAFRLDAMYYVLHNVRILGCKYNRSIHIAANFKDIDGDISVVFLGGRVDELADVFECPWAYFPLWIAMRTGNKPSPSRSQMSDKICERVDSARNRHQGLNCASYGSIGNEIHFNATFANLSDVEFPAGRVMRGSEVVVFGCERRTRLYKVHQLKGLGGRVFNSKHPAVLGFCFHERIIPYVSITNCRQVKKEAA